MKYITSTDLAKILGVSKVTILNYVKCGKIKFYHKLPSGHLRFSEEDVIKIKKDTCYENNV